MNVLKAPIDYEGLERELHDALKAEELYSLQNDAKFRAIEQAVPTYEDFREMVNAAHLKSLNRKDMTPKVGVQWNSVLNDKTSSQSEQRLKSSFDRRTVKQISSNAKPRNTHEFRQAWKGLVDHTDKFQLLSRTRLALCNEIFRSEIPPDVLNECLCVCLESLKSLENRSSIIDILIALSECNRFQLAVAFMSEKERAVCRDLFRELHRVAVAKNEVVEIIDKLEKKYVS